MLAAIDWGYWGFFPSFFLFFSQSNCLWAFEDTALPLPRIQGGSCPELASGAPRHPEVRFYLCHMVHLPARSPLPARGPKDAGSSPATPTELQISLWSHISEPKNVKARGSLKFKCHPERLGH